MKLKTEQYQSIVRLWHRWTDDDKLAVFLSSLNDLDTLHSVSYWKRMALATRRYHYTTEFYISEPSKRKLESKLNKVLTFLKDNNIKIAYIECSSIYAAIY